MIKMGDLISPTRMEEDSLRDCNPDLCALIRCPNNVDSVDFERKVICEDEKTFQFVDCSIKVEETFMLDVKPPAKSLNTDAKDQSLHTKADGSLDGIFPQTFPEKKTVINQTGSAEKEFSLKSVLKFLNESPELFQPGKKSSLQHHKALKCGAKVTDLRETYAENNRDPSVCGPVISCRSDSKIRKPSHVEYECDFCGKRIAGKISLKMHVFSHTRFRPYACLICPAKFALRRILKRHFRSHVGRIYPCEICPREFLFKRYLNTHMLTHKNLKVCEVCAKKFVSVSQLKDHLASHLFECQECRAKFSSLSKFKKHKCAGTDVVILDTPLFYATPGDFSR